MSFVFLFFKHYLNFALNKINCNITFNLKKPNESNDDAIELEFNWNKNISVADYKNCFYLAKEKFKKIYRHLRQALKKRSSSIQSKDSQQPNASTDSLFGIKSFLYQKVSKDSANILLYKPFFKDINIEDQSLNKNKFNSK